ncbi:MAG: transcription elongation factor GreB [Nannocystis sp.]|jgi:transcription elongation factor GreB|nr:transcription elongation factor GreB [Nannocystis sp.]
MSGEPRAKTNFITPEGQKKLKAELDQLWRVERPRVTSEVAAAAALGDRSENAEYIYGKRRLREIDRRLEFLAKRLESLKVFAPRRDPDGKVLFGNWVTLEDEEGAEISYRLVGPDEWDADAGLISVDSPVGRALLGKQEGDEVLVRRPRGDALFTILAVACERP